MPDRQTSTFLMASLPLALLSASSLALAQATPATPPASAPATPPASAPASTPAPPPASAPATPPANPSSPAPSSQPSPAIPSKPAPPSAGIDIPDLPPVPTLSPNPANPAPQTPAQPDPSPQTPATQPSPEQPFPPSLLSPDSLTAPSHPAGKTVSSSQQFTITGPQADIRSSVATLVEDYKRELATLFDLEKDWKFPVTIVLHGQRGEFAPPNPVRRELRINAGVPSFLLHLHCGEGIPLRELQSQIHEILLYERSLRNLNPDSLPAELHLPAWLSTGITEAVIWRNGLGEREKYASLFRGSQQISIRQILGQTPAQELDAISRGAFEASSGALVMCLLAQPDAKAGLRAMLDATIQGDQDSEALLKRHFPALTLSRNSLSKWWAIQTAKLAQTPLTQALSIPETDQKLGEILTIGETPDKPGMDLANPANLAKFLATPEVFQAHLKNLQNKLVHLSYRAYPSYRPILVEYTRISQELLLGKTRDQIATRLTNLANERDRLRQSATRARDYLDWVEITQSNQASGEFSGYLRTMELLRKELTPPSPPHIKAYLDDIERLMNSPAR